MHNYLIGFSQLSQTLPCLTITPHDSHVTISIGTSLLQFGHDLESAAIMPPHSGQRLASEVTSGGRNNRTNAAKGNKKQI
ncbi:MAG: hypothetical protein V3V59_08545, partial [Thermodesulfovibrionales bacterium]